MDTWKYEYYETGFEEPYQVHEFVNQNGKRMDHYDTEEYLNLLESFRETLFKEKRHSNDCYFEMVENKKDCFCGLVEYLKENK